MEMYLTLKTLLEAILATGYLESIFHSVLLQTDSKGMVKAVAPVSGRYIYVGIADNVGFSAYCRELSDIRSVKEENLTATTKLFTLSKSLRFVFFNLEEKRSHLQIKDNLINAFMLQNKVRFDRIINQHATIVREEAPKGKFTFSNQTFLFAVDVTITERISGTYCPIPTDCFSGLQNPYGKPLNFTMLKPVKPPVPPVPTPTAQAEFSSEFSSEFGEQITYTVNNNLEFSNEYKEQEFK